MSMEAFELDLAVCGLAGALLGLAWLRFLGQEEELAISQDAIYIEEKQVDFAGAGLSGEFWHREL